MFPAISKARNQEGHNMWKNTLVVVFAVLLAGCATAQSPIASSPQVQGTPPVVLDAYAAKVIRPGATWLIFLRAEDTDGDMKSIAAVLWQAGVGYYPTEVNMLKAEDARQFSGYLSMMTPADFDINWDQFELTLILRDSRNNRSQPVKLPLTFDMGAATQQIPENWQGAAQYRIATLMFRIVSSSSYNSNRRGRGWFWP
jgi:hypothetical protein